MVLARKLIAWCGAAGLVAMSGCARAYHDYPCGCVPYGYCPPPPLAYIPYDGCPTPIAQCYASEHPPGMQTAPPVQVEWR